MPLHPSAREDPFHQRSAGAFTTQTARIPVPRPATSAGLSFFPAALTFIPGTMDVYSGNGQLPPLGALRQARVPIGITGVFPEGHRTRISNGDAYTHIILCDPGVSIFDSYRGYNLSRGPAYDALAIRAGGVTANCNVVFSFITNIPGLGPRRVILADRGDLSGIGFTGAL